MLSNLGLFFIILKINQVFLGHVEEHNILRIINNGDYLWKAKHSDFLSFHSEPHHTELLMGANMDDSRYPNFENVEYKLNGSTQIPISFDARQWWKLCPSLSEISEQGLCASSWAVAAAATMTDRYCIYSNQTLQKKFSAYDILSCSVNWGCSRSGEVTTAWEYWKSYGVVSGGAYGSKEGCQPYPVNPCSLNESCPPTLDLPRCEHRCQNNYMISYKNDKAFPEKIYAIKGGHRQIQMEILTHGPVEAVMEVHEDFLNYEGGVYHYVTGAVCGGHAVKLLGWGEEDGVEYWLAANSWGRLWGENGFFKIMRGIDHCNIESTVVAGEPRIEQANYVRYKLDDEPPELMWNTQI